MSRSPSHKFRGKGNANMDKASPRTSHSKYGQKHIHATPSATQFGTVWETNFTPMSRMAYSQSNKKKYEQKKYKSGHVRRETRLKLAMEKMKDIDISALSAEAINDAKTKARTSSPRKAPSSG